MEDLIKDREMKYVVLLEEVRKRLNSLLYTPPELREEKISTMIKLIDFNIENY